MAEKSLQYGTHRIYWKCGLWHVPEICLLGVRKSSSWEHTSQQRHSETKPPKGVLEEAAGHWMLLIALIAVAAGAGHRAGHVSCGA